MAIITRLFHGVTDRTGWYPGEWDAEPDKMQWQDETSGYVGLITRHEHFGNLCGYIGVPKSHPLHGSHYGTVVHLGKDYMRSLLAARGVAELYEDDVQKGDVQVQALLDAHGGITYADHGATITKESWQKTCQYLARCQSDAERHPLGDSARFIKRWAKACKSYTTWQALAERDGLFVYGAPVDTWYFGFDCGHAWDYAPGLVASTDRLMGSQRPRPADEVYRTMGFVREQCDALARQLHQIEITLASVVSAEIGSKA